MSWWYRACTLALVLSACSWRARAQDLPDAGALALPLVSSLDASAPLAPVDVTVRAKSKVEQVRESARAVDVIDLERDHRFTADLGTVLARNEGINVRRGGALGSDARLSLNGLGDEQVRVFIDGVPLELAGYPFGFNNVPVELIRRVDVHRGVVPLRLGSDALGGAVELISDEGTRGTHGRASYQLGSFDTHRLLASGRHHDPRTGLFVRAEGFFDHSRNDYPMRVTLDRRPIIVRRNNDDYRAGFASVEAGVVHRPWARKLVLRGFFGDMDKGVPHSPDVGVPFGAVRADRRATGATARFESVPLHGFELSAIGGYNLRTSGLRDLSSCSFDWTGQCVFDRAPSRGETERGATDTQVDQRSGFGRILLSRALAGAHVLRLASAPTFTRRTGENRALPPMQEDELNGNRDLFTLLTGFEYQLTAFDERLENIVFAKHYFIEANALQLGGAGGFEPVNRSYHRVGGGDALRWRFSDWFYAKTSYEYATRPPSPDQLYGDPALLLQPSFALRPETAHNFNLSAALDLRETSAGAFRGQLTFFSRHVDQLIWMFLRPYGRIYNNVDSARSIGIEGNLGWTSPERWISLDGNATFQDYRNRSESGEAAQHRGARIANQPYFFFNAMAQLHARRLLPENDDLALIWRTSYVHDFTLSWDNAAPSGVLLRVPAQLVHTLGVSLLLRRDRTTTIGTTLEVHNITDARVYDFYGVQLPGRAVAAKFTIGF